MALGFDVILVGVHIANYRVQELQAWRRDVTWFDDWDIKRDEHIKQCDADQFCGIYTPYEVNKMVDRYEQYYRPDGKLVDTPTQSKIISPEPGTTAFFADKPRSPTPDELRELLKDGGLKWVIVHLWDKS